MLSFKPKTRSTSHIYTTPEDFVPECHAAVKSFKRLTPEIKNRLQKLLDQPPETITSRSRLIDYLQDNIFALGRGAHSDEQRRALLGWSEQEIADLSKTTNERALKGYKAKYGNSTCFTKEYWMIKGMSEEQAIAKVSEIQRGNSAKLDDTVRRTFLKNVRDSIHYEGMSDQDAEALITEHQREQSKRCREYWMKRGASEQEAKAEVTFYQVRQSKFSPEYWQDRGLSVYESRTKATDLAHENFRKNQRLSIASQKLFEELQSLVPERKFLFGKEEMFIRVDGERRRCYFLDFYDEDNKLNIEFDGSFWHKNTTDKDAERDKFLTDQGIKVLRISDKLKFSDAVNRCLKFLEGI